MSTATNKLADKLDAMADRLQKGIDHGRRDMTQNATPKRLKEYKSRLHDADNWERAQRAMRALAEAHRAGNVPAVLQDVTTKDEILRLVRKSTLGGGYYDVIPNPEYADNSGAGRALQAMIAPRTAEQAKANADRQGKQELQRMIDDLRFCDIPGFFPTPPAVIETMLLRADLKPGQTVLEPSAGIGSIADAILDHAKTWQSGAVIDLLCCEIRHSLRAILTAKGHALTAEEDFLEVPADVAFDRIIMNPPFERLQDAAHVRHAYDCLAPGGRLVSLMSHSAFINDQRKAVEFREWLAELDSHYDVLPEGCFKGIQAFRQTGVRVIMVTIDKQ